MNTDNENMAWLNAPLYTVSGIPAYDCNPFIAALPPIKSKDEILDALERHVRASADDRERESHYRLHLIDAIEEFMQPLDLHLGLYQRIESLIRRGYRGRNPLEPKHLRNSTYARANDPNASGWQVALLGQTGIGKSWAIRSILQQYRQVICHPDLPGELEGALQLVYITLECPEDASLKGLCLKFLHEVDRVLGTQYAGSLGKRAPIDEFTTKVASIASIHGLGLLVIDEIQHLSLHKSGGTPAILAFFKTIADVLRVPIVAIGTMDALGLLGGDVQTARRYSGLELWERLKPGDENFRFLVECLLQAQYVREPIEISDELVDHLYGLTEGLPDVLVKLFIHAQREAINTGVEKLTLPIIDRVFDRQFRLLHRGLHEIRENRSTEARHLARIDGRSRVREVFAERPVRQVGDPSAEKRSSTQSAQQAEPAEPVPAHAKRTKGGLLGETLTRALAIGKDPAAALVEAGIGLRPEAAYSMATSAASERSKAS